MKKKSETKLDFKVSFAEPNKKDIDLVMCNFKLPKELNSKLNEKLKSSGITKVRFFRAVVENYLNSK